MATFPENTVWRFHSNGSAEPHFPSSQGVRASRKAELLRFDVVCFSGNIAYVPVFKRSAAEILASLSQEKGPVRVLHLEDSDTTDQVMRRIFSQIQKLGDLKDLHLDGNSISDRGFGHLRRLSLQHLSIKRCPNLSQKAVDECKLLQPRCVVHYY